MELVSNRVSVSLRNLADRKFGEEKRCIVANNLIVIAKEKAGAFHIIEQGGLTLIHKEIDADQKSKMNLPLVRALSEISKHDASFTIKVLDEFSIEYFLLLMVDQFTSEESTMAVQYLVQTFINSLTGYDPKNNTPPKEVTHQDLVDEIMIAIAKRTSSRAMCPEGRDTCLELVSRNVGPNALNQGKRLLESGCLENLLDVAAELEDLKHESSMKCTRNTKSLSAIALERTYECMDCDKSRETFREKCMSYIKDKFRGGDVENRIRGIVLVTTLLQGPVEVGNFCLSQQGIVEMMLLMANSDDDEVQQKIAAEAIIAAASRKEKCTSIASMGSGILKKLYQSPNETIKVRALVGLCKIGSAGGADASFKPFSDESIHKLAKACKKIIVDPKKDRDIKKWASEGLAYLSLDADVKENLIADKGAIQALINLAKTGDLSLLYGIVTTFVNLTNSHDKKEIMPEMIELAKFAKQHVPKEHPKDAKEFVEKRVRALASMDITSALVALCKTESISSREMIARVFNAVCEYCTLRGQVVQQGGVKALLSLFTSSNTARGKAIAALALARIAISINPSVAFPGQRIIEVIRPLMSLLNVEYTALENFEALMAITNVAQVDETTQRAIMQNGGFSKIEHYVYEDHPMLKRAAVECITNMITYPDIVKLFEEDNDRVKFWFYLCSEEDRPTVTAATGGLAMLTGVSKITCEKMLQVKDWEKMLTVLLAAPDHGVQHRSLVTVKNIIFADKTLAEKIIGTKLFNVLMAITLPEYGNSNVVIRHIAIEILGKCQTYGLIKPLNG